MVVSQTIRRFFTSIIPVLTVLVVIILQTVSVMANAGTGPRVGTDKGQFVSSGLGLTTQDLISGTTPTELANTLVGPGVTVTNVIYTGSLTAAGVFSGGAGIIGFEEGIILSSGDMNDVVGPNQLDTTTTEQLTPGDLDLDMLVMSTTFDAAVLEFDFIPDQSRVSFQFVFASEEYNEFVLLGFNDVFGFFINGVNCASVDSLPISVDSINLTVNPSLFRNNDRAIGSPINTEADGLTVVLTCNAPVNPGIINHMKLAIADVSDRSWDSWVFLKRESLTTDISISLGPNPGQSCQGDPHTLVAVVADTPQENIPVSFEIISGPNTGPLGSALTNADGIATLTYTSTGNVAAVDVAQASFVGSDGQSYYSEEVPVNWDLCGVRPTPPPPPSNCTYELYFWKNHPEIWPVTEISIGNFKYSQSEAIEILETLPEGDATYVLARHLIATKLNILNGADGTVVASVVVDADAWLTAYPLGTNPSNPERQVGIDLADILDDYNEGDIGPGECDD